ncbi:Uncharacterised protein [uncultured archaeon]|nr:Uncharacterised protein [uncultured archaeon]
MIPPLPVKNALVHVAPLVVDLYINPPDTQAIAVPTSEMLTQTTSPEVKFDATYETPLSIL